jgi:hypothetical protein
MADVDRAADGGRGDDAPLEIPMPLLCASAAIRLEILRDGRFMWAAKESPMLDLLFLGGGFLLLCLLIAYARLINQI